MTVTQRTLLAFGAHKDVLEHTTKTEISRNGVHQSLPLATPELSNTEKGQKSEQNVPRLSEGWFLGFTCISLRPAENLGCGSACSTAIVNCLSLVGLALDVVD